MTMLVDPLEFHFQLLGREADRAEHPEAARSTHRSHHVAAVAESKNRQLDS